MQTLNVSYADYARHPGLLELSCKWKCRNSDVGFFVVVGWLVGWFFVFHARASVFFPWHR